MSPYIDMYCRIFVDNKGEGKVRKSGYGGGHGQETHTSRAKFIFAASSPPTADNAFAMIAIALASASAFKRMAVDSPSPYIVNTQQHSPGTTTALNDCDGSN